MTTTLFIKTMGMVVDLPHLYTHLGISLSMWVLVICLVVLDLIDGVYTAKRMGKRIHSHKLRATICKFGEYWRFLLFGFVFDFGGVFFPWYGYPYMTIAITVGLSVIEFKSMLEHAKKRKSKTAELPEILQQVIDCTDPDDAKKIIKTIVKTFDDGKSE